MLLDMSLQEKAEEWLAAHLLQYSARMSMDPLHEAYVYALTSGGRRLRPILVALIGEALGLSSVEGAAVAIECFHTASLIVDDLPCMDDATERRGKLPLHKMFGENTALLVSYGLIASGYAAMEQNGRHLSLHLDREERVFLGFKAAAMRTGMGGIVGGQFLDLHPRFPMTPAFLKEVAQKKSASLFELAFMLGWVFGGGSLEKLDWAEQAGSHFGVAFQILDDLADQKKDVLYPKTVNIAVVLGERVALDWLEKELEGFWRAIEKLSLERPRFETLMDWLHQEA